MITSRGPGSPAGDGVIYSVEELMSYSAGGAILQDRLKGGE